jgi:fumarate reductase subunit D
MTGGAKWRKHTSYGAFVVHRLTGLLLALYVPVHLYVLGLAIEGEATLDSFLRWTEAPLIKLTEVGMALVLAAHLAGGLRLLAVEFLPWTDRQKTLIAIGGGFSCLAALLFLLRAF